MTTAKPRGGFRRLHTGLKIRDILASKGQATISEVYHQLRQEIRSAYPNKRDPHIPSLRSVYQYTWIAAKLGLVLYVGQQTAGSKINVKAGGIQTQQRPYLADAKLLALAPGAIGDTAWEDLFAAYKTRPHVSGASGSLPVIPSSIQNIQAVAPVPQATAPVSLPVPMPVSVPMQPHVKTLEETLSEDTIRALDRVDEYLDDLPTSLSELRRILEDTKPKAETISRSSDQQMINLGRRYAAIIQDVLDLSDYTVEEAREMNDSEWQQLAATIRERFEEVL